MGKYKDQFDPLKEDFPAGYLFSHLMQYRCEKLRETFEGKSLASVQTELVELVSKVGEPLGRRSGNEEDDVEEYLDLTAKYDIDFLQYTEFATVANIGSILKFPRGDYTRHLCRLHAEMHEKPRTSHMARSNCLDADPFSDTSRMEIVARFMLALFSGVGEMHFEQIYLMSKSRNKINSYNKQKSEEASARWRPLLDEVTGLVQERGMSVNSAVTNVASKHGLKTSQLRSAFYRKNSTED